MAALAGCGGDDEKSAPTTARTPAPATTPEASKSSFTVTEREYSLTPSNPDLPATGEYTITVRNAGGTRHALEVEAPAGEAETDTIQPGGTAQLKVKLTKPGRYVWYCPVGDHKDRGMRGTIVVAGGRSKADDSGGDKKDGRGRDDSGDDSGRGGGSGRNDDSARDDTMESEGDSGGIGPSNDSNDGYGPG
jgi:plastocyanin